MNLKITHNIEYLLGTIYNLLIKYDSELEHVKDCILKWMQNLNTEVLKMEEWEFQLQQNIKFTSGILRENWYKLFYFWYITPLVIAKISNLLSVKCWKFNEQMGSFYYMWWQCCKIKQYWKLIIHSKEHILKVIIPFQTEIFLLSFTKPHISSKYTELAFYIIISVRILYAFYWIRSLIPSMAKILITWW